MTNWKKAKAEKTAKAQPTHLAKIRHGKGDNASYERLGAAWVDEDTGSVFVKLHGTQIISEPFVLYPIED